VSVLILAAAGGHGHGMVGAGLAVASAALYDAGYVLEKRALDELDAEPGGAVALLRLAARSPVWVAGFASMLAGLALQVLALTLAPVWVVQPILAGGLLGLAAAGPQLLGERLDARHRWALILVLAAVGASAGSAGGPARVSDHVSDSRLVMLVVGAALLAATLHRREPRRVAAAAAAAGLLYGAGAVAEKAVATRLASRGLLDGALASLGTPYPWLFGLATLLGLLAFQVGLRSHPATLMASLTNVVSSVCVLAGAALVFGEALLPATWWRAAFRLGAIAAAVSAVVLLALGSAETERLVPEGSRP
jgi:hypothetical protein